MLMWWENTVNVDMSVVYSVCIVDVSAHRKTVNRVRVVREDGARLSVFRNLVYYYWGSERPPKTIRETNRGLFPRSPRYKKLEILYCWFIECLGLECSEHVHPLPLLSLSPPPPPPFACI